VNVCANGFMHAAKFKRITFCFPPSLFHTLIPVSTRLLRHEHLSQPVPSSLRHGYLSSPGPHCADGHTRPGTARN
jgi:hypothetical protein